MTYATLQYVHNKLKDLAYRNPDLVIQNGFNRRTTHPSAAVHEFSMAPSSVGEMLKIVNHLLEYPCNLYSEIQLGTGAVGFRTLTTDVVDAWGSVTSCNDSGLINYTKLYTKSVEDIVQILSAFTLATRARVLKTVETVLDTEPK